MTDTPPRIRQAFADRYPVERTLGRGGMATVYLARDLKHGRQVAVKVLHPELAAGLGHERFLREIRIEAGLQHPHILPLHDSGEALVDPNDEAGLLYYVMPYVEGESLRQRLGREGRLSVAESLRIVGDVGDALAYAHARGVIHRDVKPENILLSGGHAMVADFGIAKAVEAAGDATLTEPGWGMGTPAYMSPEQIAGGNVDGRSDIYGLACVLYELLAGQPPFTGSNARAIFTRHQLDEVPPLGRLRSDVPQHVEEALVRALAKEPDDRFESVGQFLEALRIQHSSQPVLQVAPSSARLPAPRSPRATSRTALVALAATGLVAIGGYLAGIGRSRAGEKGLAASVAVIPIEDLDGDSSQAHIAAGLTDELITDLAKIQHLKVINRHTMERFGQSGKTPRQVAQELGVDAVVTATMQRLGDTVHLSAQITRAGEDGTLWADSYDGTRSDLLRLQREIARSVAVQLRGPLSGEEKAGLASGSTVDPEALDLYERGRRFWNRRGKANLLQAIRLFNQALDRDPRFALAYSGQADAYVQLGYSVLAPDDAFPKARSAAEKALALDSTLAEPHAALAFVFFYYDWDWTAAEREFLTAIRRNPGYATAYEWYGLYLAAMGRFDSAQAVERTAMSLEPLSVPVAGTAAWVMYYSGNVDEARRLLTIALRTDSTFALGRLYLGRVEQARGDTAAALANYRNPGILKGWVPSVAGIGNINGVMGRRVDALRELARLDSLERTGVYVTPYGRALVWTGLGDRDRSFAELNRAVDGRSHWLVWLNRDTRWESIRNDPRFVQVVSRVGLPP
jgi:TolB-like protein/Tfp pilus assembly protein PilF/tRNA A-37 threonylcarbamoyl transferase component Bud32